MSTQYINKVNELLKNKKYDQSLDILFDNIKDITKWSYKLTHSDEIQKDPSFDNFKYIIELLLESQKYVSLDGKYEMNNNDAKYLICIGDSVYKLKLFVLYIILFYIQTRSVKKDSFVGIDYEFNNRKIALMQSCFFCKNTQNIVWIINPIELDQIGSKILVDFLMTRRSIYKILHGSDSLDVPYMYQDMFNNDKKKIQKFTSRLIDTRFLCEYYRLIDNPEEKKCSLYDALLLFNTISKEKYNQLNEISDIAGPIQDISWNIHKISSFNIKYAYYDVIFLKRFLFDIFKMAKIHIHDKYKSFKYIPVLTRFVLQEKHEGFNIIINAKKEIDPINNYIIKYKDTNWTLVSLFNKIIDHLILPEINCDLYYVININLFKTPLTLVFKKIIYYLVSTQYTIYINKNEIYQIEYDLNGFYDELLKYKYYRFINILKMFQNVAQLKIHELLNK